MSRGSEVAFTMRALGFLTVLAYSFALSDDSNNRIKALSLSDKNDCLYGGVILTAEF
jgi:hypothetical protein